MYQSILKIWCNITEPEQIKFVTKFHRMRGVHVTPTVYANGLEAVEVSSGWNVDQWKEFVDKLLAA